MVCSITEYCAQHDITPDDCVEEMRRTVFENTKLTVSAGIAPNKVRGFCSFILNTPSNRSADARKSE